MNDNICFFYHRTKSYNVTIAYQQIDGGQFRFGAAFCRPEDQFSKRLGRDIAVGRMGFCEPQPLPMNNPARWQVHSEILKSLDGHAYDYIPDSFWSGSE